MTRGTDTERGAVLVMAAVFWLVLAGVAALVVDLGLARQRRADAQAAVDAAVLAALGDLASSDVAARQTAADYVVQNGFERTEAIVNLPPTQGRRANDDNCIEVTVSDQSRSLFAHVLGSSALQVGARAVGCVETGGGSVPAIFAAATECDEKNLKFAGSETVIIGGVHSNDAIELPGSDNDFYGDFTWSAAGYFLEGGSGNYFDHVPAATGLVGWPLRYDINDFAPGGSEAIKAATVGRYYNSGSEDMSIGWLTDAGAYDPGSHVLQPGLYYSRAKIDLSDSDITIAGGLGVTLVSSGSEINLAGSDHDLRPYIDDLLVFGDYQKESPQWSTSNCDSSAASISGSNSSWEGIIYVPRGQVKLNGSDNTTLRGAVLAYTVEASGSELSIDSTGLSTPTDADPKLVE